MYIRMSSLALKNISSLISPLKSKNCLTVLSSPAIVSNKKSLSATSETSRLKTPDIWSGNRHCKTQHEINKHSSSGKKSLLKYKAVRCLFSPTRSPKLPTSNTPCSDKDVKSLPSFDTPFRKSITVSEFGKKNFKSYILGKGSYGLVMEGKYKNKRVAVKIISNQGQTDNLTNEMNALKLRHPNITKTFKVIVGPDIGYVYMELFGNVNLEHVLHNEVVNYLEKLRYLKQIGSALECCHSNGILHLDVKPKNIIVNTKVKTCKLCDFGSSVLKIDSTKTDTHKKGTLIYTAPELLKGENPTEKCDIYSFGITIWQTIHQEVPYEKENLQQVVYKVVKQNYRPATSKALFSNTICQIYEACWQSNPSQRPTMSQILFSIEKIY